MYTVRKQKMTENVKNAYENNYFGKTGMNLPKIQKV